MARRRRNVLIIDDDHWLAAQFARQLEKDGYTTQVVPHALEGMSVIDQHKPDVIILDVFMPGPNGFVLLHEIRSHSDLANIPIILCTNSAADIPHGNLAAYGVDSILDKTTMDPSDVVTSVRKVLL